MDSNRQNPLHFTFNIGHRRSGQLIRHYLPALFRIPLRFYPFLFSLTDHVHDFLLLGRTGRFFSALDILAGDFRRDFDGQKPQMGGSRHDGFCPGTNIFDLHDPRSGHSLH